MKTQTAHLRRFPIIIVIAGALSLTLAGCATAPESPSGAGIVRAKLTALQSNSMLATHAPVEIREAETAVRIAESPMGKDLALGAHRVYMADQLVEIASAKATTRYAEDQRAVLVKERDQARLNARTNEADLARRESALAKSAVDASRAAAESSAASADRQAANAARESIELQRQIDELKAQATDRGLVLTLGDVLFATGRSDLTFGGNRTLDKLITFLHEHPNRRAAIEGHTDDVGSVALNQALSQRRAESVKSYLVQGGIASARLSAAGLGEMQPVADNSSQSGRQQNRRVEIIINNPPPAGATAASS